MIKSCVLIPAILAVHVTVSLASKSSESKMFVTREPLRDDVSTSLLQVSLQIQDSKHMEMSSHEKDKISNHVANRGCGIDKKSFDVVLFGVTGHAGLLAALHLSNGALPQGLQWAIAGRDMEALKTVVNENRLDRQPGQAPTLLIADLENYTSLSFAAQHARVILNFATTGNVLQPGTEPLIQAAVSNCAHYVDATEQIVFMTQMFAKYSQLAFENNVAIVQAAGLEALPGSLVTLRSAEVVADDGGGPPDVVEMLWTAMDYENPSPSSWFSSASDDVNFSASLLDVSVGPAIPCLHSDPGVLTTETEGSTIFGSSIDCPIVSFQLSSRFSASNISVQYIVDNHGVKTCVLEGSGKETTHTKTGLYPILDQYDTLGKVGNFAITGQARRARDGRTAKVKMEGHGDPFYLGPAVFGTELAIGLVQNAATSGWTSPALALGSDMLMRRLQQVADGRYVNFSTTVDIS